MQESKTILVTGGGGFLGKKVCEKLLEKNYNVISLSRKNYPELEKMGVKTRACDLSKKKDLEGALEGVDAVIHTAAKAGIWGNPEEFHQTNTIGTQNLLEACKKHNLKTFIYTSSPSVCFAGKDILGADESLPYASPPLCTYAKSKILAEKLVLKATKESSLKAACLRPHLIWGPNDPHFLPRLKEKSRSGKLFRLGQGRNLVDVIYVDNAADAHVKLLEKLFVSETPRGKAYFIGQDKPVLLWDFLSQILGAIGEKSITKSIPYGLAYAAGFLNENLYKAFRVYDREPKMTSFVAMQLGKSHYFSHKAAKADFDYQPLISTQKGLELLKNRSSS